MGPKQATLQAMSEVSAPVIAVGLVLSAVFIPCAFISGITGQFFRQFALTIASSTILSTINSLTLSPALSALLLRPRQKGQYQALPRLAFVALGAWQGYVWLGPHLLPFVHNSGLMGRVASASLLPEVGSDLAATPAVAAGLAGALLGGLAGWVLSNSLNRALGWFFDLFNRGFTATAGLYSRLVGGMLRVFVLVFLVYAGLLFLTYHKFLGTPRGFIPAQDMGYMLVNVQLPDSASLERTERVMRQINEIATRTPGVTATVGFTGQSFLLNAYGSNFGTMFITLDEFKNRPAPGGFAFAIENWVRRRLGLKEKPAPPDLYYEAIMKKLRGQFGQAIPEANIAIFGPPPVRGVGRAGGWMLMIEDRGDLGSTALQKEVENLSSLGNDGIDLKGMPIVRVPTGSGKTPVPARQSTVQGLASVFRANVPQVFLDVDRTACMIKGVELGDVFMTLQAYLGSLYVNDFNRFGRTWQVIVQAMANYRDQKDDINRLQVRNKRGTMVPLGAVASVREINGPLAVILSVPLCMLSALLGVTNAKLLGANNTSLDINIFTQIGLVVLVGLASKNSILIVQFAKLIHGRGKPIREATLEACRLRLRPIIMTSMAFILGVVPLLFAHGAGAEMRQSLGVAVFSGMLGVTFFGVLLTPVFFYVIDTVAESRFFANPVVRRVGRILVSVVPFILCRELFRFAFRRVLMAQGKPQSKTEEPELAEHKRG